MTVISLLKSSTVARRNALRLQEKIVCKDTLRNLVYSKGKGLNTNLVRLSKGDLNLKLWWNYSIPICGYWDNSRKINLLHLLSTVNLKQAGVASSPHIDENTVLSLLPKLLLWPWKRCGYRFTHGDCSRSSEYNVFYLLLQLELFSYSSNFLVKLLLFPTCLVHKCINWYIEWKCFTVTCCSQILRIIDEWKPSKCYFILF